MKSKAFITAALALIGILLIGGIALYSQNGSVTMNTGTPTTDTTGTTDTTTQTPTGTNTGTTGTTATSGAFKDGTYTAIGHYVSPGGAQSVSVTVTLKNDVVSDVTVVSGAVDSESRQYQNKFISGIKQQVVGKKINALSVSEVSGSSLTSGGFNDAITQIETQARA